MLQIFLALKMGKDATVKLFTCNLQNENISGFYHFMASVSPGRSNDGREGKHWAIAVQFVGDSQIYFCELCRNSDDRQGSSGSGRINWRCERMTKEEAKRGKSGITVHLMGAINTTPEKLQKKCSNISYNYKQYNVAYRNCQDWARALLREYDLYTSKIDYTFGPWRLETTYL